MGRTTVRVSGVMVRDRSAGTERIERGALVVGADGWNSIVAGTVGAEMISTGRQRGSYLYAYWAELHRVRN